MSTKTTFKRIALGTVAAMGFGLLAVVTAAPARAVDTACTATNLGAGTTGTVTAATTTIGSVTRTGINTFTAPVSIDIVGTSIGATSTVVITGTHSHTGSSTGVLSLGGAAACTATRNSATSATVTGTLTITAATDTALANVAALAGGYVITLSANIDATAAVASAAVTTTIATASVTAGSLIAPVAAVGSTSSALIQQVNGQGTVNFITGTADTSYTVTTSGVGTILSATPTTTAVANLNGTTAAAGVSWTPVTTVQRLAIVTTSTVVGTQTIRVQPIGANGIPGTAITALITWGDAPATAAALSTAFIGTGTAFATAEAAAGALRFPSTAATTVHANISVTLNDANGTAINNQSISATVSGPGLISATPGNGAAQPGTARSVSITAANNTTNQFTVGISADGTRGVSTITVLRGTTVIATKTVTFYGAVATLTATQGVGVMRSGRTAASAAADFVLGGSSATELAADATTRAKATNISIVAADVDGNIVPLAVAPTADISDLSVISDVTITSCANGGALTVCASGAGNWIASTMPAIGGVSGAKATVTFKTPHPTVPGTFISTAALPFSLGGTKTGGTVTMTLDKAVYEPGERMIITYTARDAAGNPVQDWTTVGTPASNKAIVGLNGAGVFVNGSHIFGDGSTELTYAPTAPGPFTITLATGTSTTATITATATVADDAATSAAQAAGDAAAEATDAANAATDAANAAAEAADAATAAAQDAADAVAALSTSVSAMIDTLRKQITSLTNLVIKIQKKVRA
jgi:hypothetical protein